MSYQALALKWRPQSFKEVVGQNHVVTTIQNAIAVGKIHHAYLFSGPRGVGKTTVARILAKTVNCANKYAETEFSKADKPEPCNQCTACEEISEGKSLDVIEMDAASNRGIDEIRQLKENVILSPASCEYKVYIIDEAHMLTTEASNALLKTLEEPPKHVIFILATTERHKILPTILSRCQNFDFRYLTYSQLIDRLKEICEVENYIVDEDGLSLIAQQSEGCLRDAENILEQLVASSGGKVNAEDVSKLLGFGSYQLMEQLIGLIIERDAKGCLQTLSALAEQGADLTQCLRNIITHFRSLRLLKHDLKQDIHASESKIEQMARQAATVPADRLEKIFAILMKASSDIKQYGYEQYNFESALINACSIQDSIQLSDALAKLTELEGKLEQLLSNQNQPLIAQSSKSGLSQRPAERDSSDSEIETAPMFDEDINAIWEELLHRLENNGKMVLRSLLNSATPVNFDGDKFTIGFLTSSDKNILDESDKPLISKNLSDIIGKQIIVDIIENVPVKQGENKSQEMTWLKLKKEAEQDEKVQLAMSFFPGEIIDIKIFKT